MGHLMELQAIASCILGGCLSTGAFALSSVQSCLVIMGIRPQWFMLFLSAIVVFAALGDRSLRQWTVLC